MSAPPNPAVSCAQCGTANRAGSLVCGNCGEMLSPMTSSQEQGSANARGPEIEAGRFAPAGAAIVMALVITGFAIMWDSPEAQFQGSDGSSGLLIIVLLAVAQIACMAPAVIVMARATLQQGAKQSRGKLMPWLVIALGSLLTIAGSVMGPALFVWIGGLAPSSFDTRQPLLIAYLAVPLIGVAILYLLANALFRPASARSAS